MNFRLKITLSLLLTFILGGVAYPQVVDIPDPNLRAAIEDALGHNRVTQQTVRRLQQLDAGNRGIFDLTGLEHATRLTHLYVQGNPIASLAPISNLKQLTNLNIGHCSLSDSDFIPVGNLTNLISLEFLDNAITDISPLARLSNLEELRASYNRITDITPLAQLERLWYVDIKHNPILDYNPLDNLSLDYVAYDESCDMPPLPLQPRLDNRTFPSAFSAWGNIGGYSSVINQPHLSDMQQLAQHDLYFNDNSFHQYFLNAENGWDLRSYLPTSIQIRDDYITLNPNMIFLMTIPMRSAHKTLFPEDSPYWVKNANGQPVSGWSPEDYLLDFTNPYVQDMIVEQVFAVERCGLYDGVFFDWWSEKTAVLADDSNLFTGGYVGFEAEQEARDSILERIRSKVRPNFLILVNTNRSTIPRTGPHINGSFMETLAPSVDFSHGGAEAIISAMHEVENSLRWLEGNLKTPHINSLEGWGFPNESPNSPRNLQWMRAFTTLSLTHSDGYVLFNDGIQHAHYWYEFWDADLGRPVSEEKTQLYDEDIPGLYIREFTNGWVVYNHSGEAQVITLPQEVQGVASGHVNTEHELPNLDGEMYLRVKPMIPADVNGDGVVNILDLVMVAHAMGTDKPEADVNGDGVVNVFDLVFVANQF